MRRVFVAIRDWQRRHVIGLAVTGLIAVLLLLYLLPVIVVTVPAGSSAVLWRRFDYFGIAQDGTITDWTYQEGTHYKLPWDRVYIYDTRLRELTTNLGVLMSNGLHVQAEVTLRFRPIDTELGNLHKYVGPDYESRLIVPELMAHARNQMSKLTPDELYSSRRQEVEQAIYMNLVQEFDVRFAPNAALYGRDSSLRRKIVAALAASQTPLTLTDIAQRVSVDPPSMLSDDVLALQRAGILELLEGGPSALYRVNPQTLANSANPSDLLGDGRPLIYVEDVLVRNIELPQAITEAIQRKLTVEQEMQEYTFRVEREVKESERKRIEAEGIRRFQDIVSEGISDRYLKWKGIDATLALAQSNNTKVVVIGSAGDGLPIILGPLESTGAPESTRKPVPLAPAGIAAPGTSGNTTPLKPGGQ
jgi:regulator of protease activity HflC (stomatin/prohibitin superfamily)